MNEKRIFTFWEPRKAILPYIRLCLKTWERNIPDYEIVILDHSNLADYLSPDMYDPILFEQFPLAVQKDAIESAILEKHGGVFMDADTIVLSDIRSIIEKQQRSDIIIFWEHLAFMIARKNAPVLGLWRREIKKRLQIFAKGSKHDITWDYLGNAIMQKLIKQCTKHQILRLDKIKYGLTPETIYWKYKGHVMNQYLDFWFREDLGLRNVFFKNQTMIALHNSWTPAWFKNLSENEVLNNPCLHSRTLKEVLNNSIEHREMHGILYWIQLIIFKNRLFKKFGLAI